MVWQAWSWSQYNVLWMSGEDKRRKPFLVPLEYPDTLSLFKQFVTARCRFFIGWSHFLMGRCTKATSLCRLSLGMVDVVLEECTFWLTFLRWIFQQSPKLLSPGSGNVSARYVGWSSGMANGGNANIANPKSPFNKYEDTDSGTGSSSSEAHVIRHIDRNILACQICQHRYKEPKVKYSRFLSSLKYQINAHVRLPNTRKKSSFSIFKEAHLRSFLRPLKAFISYES